MPPLKKRILALDFGLKRIGLAISDENQKIALPIKTLEVSKNPVQTLLVLINFLKEKDYLPQLETIVLGHPLLLSGQKGQMAELVENFQKKLAQQLELPVVLWDERLSSAQAEKMLLKDYSRKQRSQIVDPIAAAIILQNYLDRKNFAF
ncbi:MAG: Holliday junction resolvase RuvX [Parachlamydiales bacterium]|jgi:putative Holliday junction resolvase